MKLLRVGSAIVNQTPLDWDNNKANIIAAIRDAREQRVDVLCFPELCVTGYGCEDAFFSSSVRELAAQVLLEILPETEDMVVSLGLPILVNNGLFNCACLISDRRIFGFVAKKHLAGDGIHYEPRWFKPWPEGAHTTIDFGGESLPIGDLIFELDGVRVGFEICEDAWVANRPGAALARAGVDIILNPSASHFAFDKFQVRQRFVLEGSRAFGVSYVYSNLIGNESGRSIFDGGSLIASRGNLLAAGPRLGFALSHVVSAVIDIDATRRIQAATGSFVPDVLHGLRIVQVDAHFHEHLPGEASAEFAPWESSVHLREEEMLRVLRLGLFDYLRKSNSRGYVVSLSGGCDSSAVSCLVFSMVEAACAELGIEQFRKRLPAAALAGNCSEEFVRELLCCVYQPTRNSGTITQNAARTLAAELGATFFEFDVDTIVQQYCSVVEAQTGVSLNWAAHDVALQNIQARARGPSVWLIANLRGAVLLSTSNRSEVAAGYATMDGDTCGGLSPIAGIDKAYLRRWLVWLETTGPIDGRKLPSLKLVNDQQPTAELRPRDQSQTDEADLMPYHILDAIERAAIRDKMGPDDVLQYSLQRFPEIAKDQMHAWVTRFFQLWCRNQWKRERYAPGFHVDDQSLDPKTWCRFPILSGGYRRELSNL